MIHVPSARHIRTHAVTQERLQYIGTLLGYSTEGKDLNSASSLTSFLASQIPEEAEGELERLVGELFEPSETLPLHSVFGILAFFVSNNKLTEGQLASFLRWIKKENHTASLEAFLCLDTPAARAFSQNVFSAAISNSDMDLLQSMILASIDFQPVLKRIVKIENDDFVASVLSRLDKNSLSGTSGGELLIDLSSTNNLRAAKILLDHGTDVDYSCNWYGDPTTPLYQALYIGSSEFVKLLLEQGADPNHCIHNCDSPLAVTAFFLLDESTIYDAQERVKYDKMFHYLIDHGANIHCTVDEEDLIEWTSLRSRKYGRILLEKASSKEAGIRIADILDAAAYGLPRLLSFLDGHKGKVTPQKLEKALYESVREDHGGVKTISVLLEAGIDPNTPTLKDRPLALARHWRKDLSPQIARLFLRAGADLNIPTLLSGAVYEESLELLTLFLDAGVDLKTFGPTALTRAVQKPNIEAMALLLDKGVDINAFGDDLSPLQEAALHESLDIARYLLDRGARVDTPASQYQGRTALQAACFAGRVEMVTLLLERGAPVNAPPASCKGVTALEAVMKGKAGTRDKSRLINLLLRNGLDIAQSDLQGSEATLSAIIKTGQVELLDIALNAGADINRMPSESEGRTPLQLAAEEGRLDIVKALYDRGAQINARPAYRFGRTALQAAATRANPNMELLRFLISKGAEVNAAAGLRGGVTAIQGASIAGNIPVIQYLVSQGALVNDRPAIQDGRTAIEGAAEHGRLDAVKLLLEYGAIGDTSGGTAFRRAIQYAEKNHHYEIVKLLKAASAPEINTIFNGAFGIG